MHPNDDASSRGLLDLIRQDRDVLSMGATSDTTDVPRANRRKNRQIGHLPESDSFMNKEEADQMINLWVGRCVFLKSLEEYGHA
jgi:hypothetical protein